MTALRYRATVIHRLPAEAHVCKTFSLEFENEHKRPLTYRGESLADFANKAFQELCRPLARQQVRASERERFWDKQGRACNLCGSTASLGMTVDHVQPRFMGGRRRDQQSTKHLQAVSRDQDDL